MVELSLRIAVCQLECHPAVVVGDHDYTAEPFISLGEAPLLADLSRHSLDVADLQRVCRERYVEWHQRRLLEVLAWLRTLNPIPDITVFPECSVPLEALFSMREFAVEHGVCVLAGTHTPRMTHHNVKQYKALGIKKRALEGWGSTLRHHTALLPIFSGKESLFHLKQVPSIFERVDVSSNPQSSYDLEVVELSIRDKRIRVLPAVCAEVLHRYSVRGDYDLAVVCAYSEATDYFAPFIEHVAHNQVPVVLANDGRFGGSLVSVCLRKEMNYWWWSSPIEGRLPKGDSILVVDVHPDFAAPQVGVVNPGAGVTLVSLASVVSRIGSPQTAGLSDEIEEAGEKKDNLVQRELLKSCCHKNADDLQRLKLEELHRLTANGSATVEWWNALGRDCVLEEIADLRAFEATLALECLRRQPDLTQDRAVDDATIGKFTRFIQACRRRLPQGEETTIGQTSSQPLTDVVLGRDDEARHVFSFLDSRKERVLLVTGLDEVGKASLLMHAILQAGRSASLRLRIMDDTTVEYMIKVVLSTCGMHAAPTNLTSLSSAPFVSALPRGALIAFEDADFLMDHGKWRDTRFPEVISVLADSLAAKQGKLVLLSARQLPLDNLDPSTIRRLPLRGLREEPRRLLLDQHLRRAGIEPVDYDLALRQQIAADLDGHPGAIILASEFACEIGVDAVVDELHSRRGVHASIVRRILRNSRFDEQQSTIVGLLSLARIEIPPQVLGKVLAYNAIPVVQSLIRMCVVERLRQGHVAVCKLVRGFADIPDVAPGLAEAFHAAAAVCFRELGQDGDTEEHLRWLAEARYHAMLCGRPDLAPRIGKLTDGLLGAARELLRRHKYEEAKPIIDEVLKATKTAEACEVGAIVYARLGKCEEALVLAKEAIAAEPTREWVVTEVGRLALHTYRDDVANEAVSLVKRLGHDSSYLATLEGQIHLRREEIADALNAFDRAVTIAAGDRLRCDAWPHFYSGRTLLKAGEVSKAIDVLYRGEEMESGRYRPRRSLLVALRTQLALAYVFDGDLENAKRMLNLVVSDDSGNPEVARVFAYYRAATGASDVALKAISELNPDRAKNRHERCQIHLFRGLFMLNIGHKERASEEFSLAHSQDPRNVFVMLRWANALVQIARDSKEDRESEATYLCAEQAKTVAAKVLDFDSDNREALRLLETIADEFNVM